MIPKILTTMYTPMYIFYTKPSFHMVLRDIPMKLNDALNEPK